MNHIDVALHTYATKRDIELAQKQTKHKRILRDKATLARRYEPYKDPSRSKYPAGHIHSKAREQLKRRGRYLELAA